ncbi:Hypothetical predicted protein [Mytilus galloprovincialis]|nr:Hypothetical predicted protein [Mytilus galloprovincialis]
MDTNKFVLLVLLTILEQTFAEPPWCRMLVDKKDSHRKYCYEEGTYRACKTSCLSIVLDQSFVANVCKIMANERTVLIWLFKSFYLHTKQQQETFQITFE